MTYEQDPHLDASEVVGSTPTADDIETLRRGVEVVDSTREREGELLDEIAELEPRTYQFLSDFETYAGELKETFEKDLGSTLSDLGIMDKRITMHHQGKGIKEDTVISYNLYTDLLTQQFYSELVRLDAGFQRELDTAPDAEARQEIWEEYEESFYHLLEVSTVLAENYDSTARTILDVAGSQSGAEGFIDASKGGWTELSEYNRNGRELLKSMTPPEGVVATAYAAENFSEGSFSFEALQGSCNRAAALVNKIHEGTPLTDEDYEEITNSIEKFFDKKMDYSTNATVAESMGMIEEAGMMTAVYALNPVQRYELGQYVLETFDSKQGRKGVEFLTNIGLLDIEQAQTLLEENLGPLGMFSSEEIEDIREVQRDIETFRDHEAHAIVSGPLDNIAITEFTSSNGILYEIVFRFAALGVALPFAFNITHPDRWGDIVTNPLWLGCVGVTGLTFDHVTGGIGEGLTSQAIAGIGVKGESPEDAEERYEWAEFNRLLGDHPETTDYLMSENPYILEDIVEAAKDDGNMSDYEFSFDDLIEKNLPDEIDSLDPGTLNPEEAARENLLERYGVGLGSGLEEGEALLDGFSRGATEKNLNDICHQLFAIKGLTSVEEIQDAYKTSREMRGLPN